MVDVADDGPVGRGRLGGRGGLGGNRHHDPPPGVDVVGRGEDSPVRLDEVGRRPDELGVPIAVAELAFGDVPQGVAALHGDDTPFATGHDDV